MAKELEALGQRFLFNSMMLQNITADFAESDWQFQPQSGGNTAHWLIGHIALYRRMIRRKTGEDFAEEAWEKLFLPRLEHYPADQFPQAGYLLDDFMQSRNQIVERFTALSDEEADADWGKEFPDGGKSIKGGCYFLHFHESYHIGQIGYIRRLIGKTGLR